MALEQLSQRITPAVNAIFTPETATLAIFGDALDNTIVVSRDQVGKLLVNGGTVQVTGGIPSVSNTTRIQIFGDDGHDHLSLDETNGVLPAAEIHGGAGDDVLIGGSGADSLLGGTGNDLLLGKGGSDVLLGGADHDTLTGGDGDDSMFGESGDDVIIWNPGDDTDLIEGGSGVDTMQVNGGNGPEIFSASANGTRVRFDRISPAPFALDLGTTENLIVMCNGGDDQFSAVGNLASLISLTVDGGAGNDTILGSNGPDLLMGGDGNDFIDGQQGNDTILMGAGDDTFNWDPGDGNDIVEGQSGVDRIDFNGSSANEVIDLSANGERLRLTRNVGNIVMDADGVESFLFNALGGADTITVNSLGAPDGIDVIVNLSGVLHGIIGDAQPDVVVIHGTMGADSIDVLGSGTSYSIMGLPAKVTVLNSEGANDSLVINSLAGNDRMSASLLPEGIAKLTMDGGDGRDQIFGSMGADVLLGGAGNDYLEGLGGNDTILMGDGNDTFVWRPGGGSDVVEGQAGIDRMIFHGSNANESIDMVANGSRVLFLRDVANVQMDINQVEQMEYHALGGADRVFLGDLTSTGVMSVTANLGRVAGSNRGDGHADQVIVSGSSLDDIMSVSTVDALKVYAAEPGPPLSPPHGNGDSAHGRMMSDRHVVVTNGWGLVSITGSDAEHDNLTINGLAGADVIDASMMSAGQMHLTLNGGFDPDVLIGSQGDDLISGGSGNDVILMGSGDDVFQWNPGDGNDTIEGAEGFDRMVIHGSAVGETLDLAANGERLRIFRNVASVVLDASDIEAVDVNLLGGADMLHVNDLTGTNVIEVNVNLAGVLGGTSGDGQVDQVIVHGTSTDDVILLMSNAQGVSAFNPWGIFNVIAGEPNNDRLIINGLAGDDVIDASGVGIGQIQLTLNGDDDDDVLIGGDGNDVLLGGNGDDVLIGGPGIDILDGGPGDNIVIQ